MVSIFKAVQRLLKSNRVLPQLNKRNTDDFSVLSNIFIIENGIETRSRLKRKTLYDVSSYIDISSKEAEQRKQMIYRKARDFCLQEAANITKQDQKEMEYFLNKVKSVYKKI